MSYFKKFFMPILGALAALATTGQLSAQPPVPSGKIASITVGSSNHVMGPDGVTPINNYGGLGALADEHSTIFRPGTLPFQPDYLFMVATHTPLQNDESGLVFLHSVSGPDQKGQWSLDYAPNYGQYQPSNPPGERNGQVFLPAMEKSNCPGEIQDPTFDLNYAAPGTVFLDPTNPSDTGGGNLLMVYEGTNTCIGLTGTSHPQSNFYSTIGITTSGDYGHSWPTYAANFTQLPATNLTQGPMASWGAWGKDVCIGNYCSDIILLQPPPQYGRYAVSAPATTVEEAIALSPDGLSANTGDSQPSAFVDDVAGGPNTYVYLVHNYAPGPSSFWKNSPLYPGVNGDLSVSQIQLNGGRARLQATHWYQGQFGEEAGLGTDGIDVGGHESAIFPNLDTTTDSYKHCLTPAQGRSGGSISYSETTNEYVLFFVCLSPSEPATATSYQDGGFNGGAWFYSTMDATGPGLSKQGWRTPKQVEKSWSKFEGSCSRGLGALNGWYPSLMSMDAKPGHLTSDGYVFYLDGCIDAPGRFYSSRSFTINQN